MQPGSAPNSAQAPTEAAFDELAHAAGEGGEVPLAMLLDLTLPDGDGLDIVRELLVEENPPTFVALTGHDTREVADRCMAAGCVSVLVKPVTSKELLAVVDPLLARRV